MWVGGQQAEVFIKTKNVLHSIICVLDVLEIIPSSSFSTCLTKSLKIRVSPSNGRAAFFFLASRASNGFNKFQFNVETRLSAKSKEALSAIDKSNQCSMQQFYYKSGDKINWKVISMFWFQFISINFRVEVIWARFTHGDFPCQSCLFTFFPIFDTWQFFLIPYATPHSVILFPSFTVSKWWPNSFENYDRKKNVEQ